MKVILCSPRPAELPPLPGTEGPECGVRQLQRGVRGERGEGELGPGESGVQAQRQGQVHLLEHRGTGMVNRQAGISGGWTSLAQE